MGLENYPIASERSTYNPFETVNSSLSAGILGPVNTLAERVEWILKHRRRPDGTRWSQRALSEAAGMSPAVVGMLRRGDTKDVRGETLRHLAAAAGVSLAWLATGKGTPDEDDDARGPSTAESGVPHFGNAVGWDDARREAERTHPYIPAWAWDQAATMAPMHLRSVVTPEQVVSLARMALQLADPRAMSAALEERDRRLAELEAQLAAKLASEDSAAKGRKR